MELKQVRTVIRDKMIELGFNEYVGAGLDIDVPNTILENSFRVKATGGSGSGINQHVLTLDNTVDLLIWKKGYRNEVEAEDAGLETIEEILCNILSVDFRTLPPFRKLGFNSYTIETIADDNDSIAKITMTFDIQVILAVTNDV